MLPSEFNGLMRKYLYTFDLILVYRSVFNSLLFKAFLVNKYILNFSVQILFMCSFTSLFFFLRDESTLRET